MPTYQYACKDCGASLEVQQSFTDDALTVCPECAGSLRKVFNAVGVVFKGSGFYRTDSRSGTGSSESTAGTSDGAKKESTSKGSTGSTDSKGSKGSAASGTKAAASTSA